MLSPNNITSYWSRQYFKATTQTEGKVGGRKGRVCIRITILILVIISYSKDLVRGRGYDGTTTTRINGHAARFTLQACPHTRVVVLPTISGIYHYGVGCLQGCRVLPEFWMPNLASTPVRCAETSPAYSRTTGIKDWGWRPSDIIMHPLSPDLPEQG